MYVMCFDRVDNPLHALLYRMRFLKFSLFPIVHISMHGIPESVGTPKTKAIAAFIAAVPESISIMPLELSKITLQLDTTNR